MNYAVIRSGNKQYKVAVGDVISVDSLASKNAETNEVIFDEVLLLNEEGKVKVGTPLVKATVKADLVKHYKGDKMRISRFKAKSNYRRVVGFRHSLTEVKITSFDLEKESKSKTEE